MKKVNTWLLAGSMFVSSLATASPITELSQLLQGSSGTTTIDFNEVTSPDGGRTLFYSGGTSNDGTLVYSGVTIEGVFSLIDTNRFSASIRFPDLVGGVAVGRPDFDAAAPNFRITFDGLVDRVGFGLFDANFSSPPTLLNAYDIGGNLLESTSPDALFPPGGSGADYLGFVRSSNDIAYLELVGSPRDFLWIDNLTFGSSVQVPAPGTFLLFGLSLFGLFGRWSRREP